MAGTTRLWLWVSVASLTALALPAGVVADHGGCPPFERLRYDYFVEFNHGGDLYSSVHVVGFTDFRFCFQLRDRVLSEEIRFDARGGLYELRVLGDAIDDTYTLRGNANQTRWYEHGKIETIQAAGVADDLELTIVPGESPPSRAEASNARERFATAWLPRSP